MKSRNEREFVAVKVEGPFTEWYAPTFKNPYDDNMEYRQYYESVVWETKPVYGPSLGDSEDDFISSDLDSLAERLAVDAEDWESDKKEIKKMIRIALENGVTYDCETVQGTKIKITPYRKCELPPVNEKSLEIEGPFADLMRERVAAI